MNPLQPGSLSRHATGSVSTAPSAPAAGAQAPSHPQRLSPASLSARGYALLNQTRGHANGHYQLMGLLAFNGISDSSLALRSVSGANVHYEQQISIPDDGPASLSVYARLNGQAEYDITGIDLEVLSSGKKEAMMFPEPLIAHPDISGEQPASVAGHLAVHYSREELTQALIQQSNPQDYAAAPLPSGASVSTRSMVFSQDGQTEMAGPGRIQPAGTAGSGPDSVSSRSDMPSSQGGNTRVPDPDNPGKTVTQKTLRHREYNREQVPDPQNPGQTISRKLLANRQPVPDPDNPERTVSQNALAKRRSDQQRVPDPENPERTISRNGLMKRQYNRARVPDPEKPGQTMSQAALNKRQRDRQRVPDPDNPGRTATRSALTQREYKRGQIPDPDNLGQTISRGELQGRKQSQQQVPDPDNPGQTVSQRRLNQRQYDRERLPDPKKPGQTITRNALRQRQRNREKTPDPDNPA